MINNKSKYMEQVMSEGRSGGLGGWGGHKLIEYPVAPENIISLDESMGIIEKDLPDWQKTIEARSLDLGFTQRLTPLYEATVHLGLGVSLEIGLGAYSVMRNMLIQYANGQPSYQEQIEWQMTVAHEREVLFNGTEKINSSGRIKELFDLVHSGEFGERPKPTKHQVAKTIKDFLR